MHDIPNFQKAKILKNDLYINLKKIRIDEEIRKIRRKDRKEWIELMLLQVNQMVLKWALQNNIITYDDIKTDKFFTENTKLTDWIVTSGLIGGGAAGAIAAGTAAYGATLTTVTTGGIFGFFTTTTTTVATTTTYIATAAAAAGPLALAGIGALLYYKGKEKKEIEKLIDYFEKEKEKIYNYYASKIDSLFILASGE